MKKINNASKIPSGYELWMNVTDSLHRFHKFMVTPIGSGSIAYFDTLSQMEKWKFQVEDMRRMQNGEHSRLVQIQNYILTGDVNEEIGMRLLQRLSQFAL